MRENRIEGGGEIESQEMSNLIDIDFSHTVDLCPYTLTQKHAHTLHLEILGGNGNEHTTVDIPQ